MKTVKYILFSVVAMLAFTDISFTQTYSITPNDTIQEKKMMEDLETLIISQLNTSANSIILKWEKVSESVPANWDAAICDNKLCYTSLLDSGKMNPVNPTEMGYLLVHVTAHVNFGTAIIRYAVWDIKFPELKDTLTFIMTVDSTSGISEADKVNAFRIFPNPASNNINISSTLQPDFSLSVTDLSGKEIYSVESTSNLKIETSNFPNGTYFIQLKTKNQIFTRKFIKQ